MLFFVDLYEDFIDVESVAIASVLAFQAACINGAELDTPETDCLSADSDTPLCQQVFDVAVTQIEAIVEPDCVGDDVCGARSRGNRASLLVNTIAAPK